MQDHTQTFQDISPPVRIVLTGFMGAGKTTVGRVLAHHLDWMFVDLDDVIVQMEGQSIAALFATIGESAFRERERVALETILPRQSLVLSLGGGAIELEANRNLLHSMPDTRVVFLEAPLEILEARCQQEQHHPGAVVRPVFADKERLLQRYIDRLPHYRTAHHTVVTTDRKPEDVALSILSAFDFDRKLPSHP